jgi:asparagine synthase (glutamine-hydrolysing)
MCGFSGYIGKELLSQKTIDKTLSLMKRRGPDSFGSSQYSINNTNVHFLHSRLTIIDDDPRSNQPMEIDRYSLIFNGEIYNYLELRDDLRAIGYTFSTESDTEVLLKMLIHLGEEAFDKLDGAWSLAFLDRKNKKLILSRDRFSEKPLYYLETNNGYYFGSSPSYILSLSGITPSINLKKLERYVRYDFKSMHIDNETFINDIKSLSFATNLIIDSNGNAKTSTYFYKHKNIEFSDTSGIANIVKQSILKSLEYRMRSDKPIAFLLSGGIDSTSLCYLASKELGKKITCFSVGNADSRYDESDNIDRTVSELGCDHFYIQPEVDAQNVSSRLIEFSKEFLSPLPGQNYLLYAELNNLIKLKGYSVVISGHGGDELFGGYLIHQNLYVKSLKGKSEFKNALCDFDKYIKPQLRNKNLVDIEGFCKTSTGLLSSFEESTHISHYFIKEVGLTDGTPSQFNVDWFKKELDKDLFYLTLPQHVVASDQVSMFFSLENRSPFLSREVYNVARGIPNNLLISKGYGKYILRKSMQGTVPNSILWDRDKKGFNFEFSSKNITDFGRLFDGINRESFFKDFLDIDKINSLINKKDINNAESKLLFRLANAKALLSSVNSL